MTKQEIKNKLISKLGGEVNYDLTLMYYGEEQALSRMGILHEEEGKCANRPLCRQMEEKGLKALLESDKTIEEDILNLINQ